VSVVHPDARRLVAALTQRNVVPDFREPDIVRLGLAPLGTSFVDVYDGLGALAELVGG
jgi:kynureninase